MLFPSFRQQQQSPFCNQGHGTHLSQTSICLLRLLPWMLLLTSSPAWAQLSQGREIRNDDRPVTPLSAETDALSQEVNSSSPNESANPSLTPRSFLAQKDSQGNPLQAKANLDSPPSPEVAATLCDGTAQSISGQVIITSETVCQSGLTPPSLWWTKEQVAQELRTSGKLVNDWSAQLKTSETPGQVRLVVNPQMWSLMDYFERYDFVSNFGIAAKDFGYQTEIYNTKGARLASYVCQMQDNSESLGSSCKMNLGSSLNFGSRASRKSFL